MYQFPDSHAPIGTRKVGPFQGTQKETALIKILWCFSKNLCAKSVKFHPAITKCVPHRRTYYTWRISCNVIEIAPGNRVKGVACCKLNIVNVIEAGIEGCQFNGPWIQICCSDVFRVTRGQKCQCAAPGTKIEGTPESALQHKMGEAIGTACDGIDKIGFSPLLQQFWFFGCEQ